MLRIAMRFLVALSLVLAVVPAAAQEDPVPAETVARIQELITELGADDWGVREKATTDLAALGAVATPYLIEAKDETEDVEVRRRISRVLTETGGWAQDPDEVRVRVGQKLDLFRTQTAFHLDNENPERIWTGEEFQAVIEELRAMGPGIGKAVAAEAIEVEEEPFYRANLIYLLAELGAKESSPILARLLADSSAEVRAAAAHSLGRLGGLELEALHRAVLEDKEPTVRLRASYALGQARDKRAVDWLIELLGHEDQQVRQTANYCLNRSTGQDHGFNALTRDERRRARAIEKWKAWWEEHREGFEFPSRPEPENGPQILRARIRAGEIVIEGPVAPPELPPEPPEFVPQEEEHQEEDR